MDYSKITLGELLSSNNETIKRNAVGILKQYQKSTYYKAIGLPENVRLGYTSDKNAFLKESIKNGWKEENIIFEELNRLDRQQ